MTLPDCETCNTEKRKAPVPFIVHEAAMARMERANKRLWIALLLVIILLVGSNCAWLWYESQFEDVSVEQEVDTGDGDAFVAGVGDIYYGESQAKNDSQKP